MIDILMWISVISGGILVLMLLLSLVGGFDLDLDVDIETDTDFDTGGLGLVKGVLTFVTFSTWIAKVIIISGINLYLVTLIAGLSGLFAVFVLGLVMKLLLKNVSNVNWHPEDAINKSGKVYLRIPTIGSGIIQVKINGSTRQLKATTDDKEIKTGSEILVLEVVDGVAKVILKA